MRQSYHWVVGNYHLLSSTHSLTTQHIFVYKNNNDPFCLHGTFVFYTKGECQLKLEECQWNTCCLFTWQNMKEKTSIATYIKKLTPLNFKRISRTALKTI